jgi:hypothetical protein
MWLSLTYLPLADAISVSILFHYLRSNYPFEQLSFLLPSATGLVSFVALKEGMTSREVGGGCKKHSILTKVQAYFGASCQLDWRDFDC